MATDIIDGITITSPGSGYSDQVDNLADQDMWATEVATPFTDFNANDWVQIPFRVNSRAGESEYDFNTGGGSGDTLTNGDWAASLNDSGSLSVDNTDDEQNYFTLTPIGNEDASYGLQIGIDNQLGWFFSNAGSITFPDDTVQTTAYTGGNGGGLSISDFGLGFTDALDAGKITTSKLYNENPNQGLNNQYTLEVTDGGVVALPDGSIINGATLKTVPGNYAGITAGPNGADEDSWVWVDNDGATIATKYSTDNYQWKFDNTGNLILPNGQSIGSGSLDGIKMTTDRGTVLFGNSPECLGGENHFHIMKDDPANVDLFLGDDNNYVKLPGNSETAYGVEIGTNVGSAYTWRFGTDGSLTFPDDTVQTTAYTGGNGGGSGDRLTNGEYSLILDSAGKLSFPGNLDIDNGVISNLNSIDDGDLVVGSQIEVVLERTMITNQVTNSLGEGGPFLQTQSLIEVMAGNVTIGSQVINSAGDGSSLLAVASLLQTNASNVIIGYGTYNSLEESTLQTVNLVEVNSNNVLIGQRVTNSLNGNVTLDAFSGWEFSTDGNLTLPAGGDILNSNGQSVLTSVTVGNVTSGAEGALWYNTEDGRTYVYALDTWIDASPAVVPGNMVGYGHRWQHHTQRRCQHQLCQWCEAYSAV
jgi:hypothetical protein